MSYPIYLICLNKFILFLNCLRTGKWRQYSIDATTTKLVQTGKSKKNEHTTPLMTEVTPIALEKKAIAYRVKEKFLAVAVGIINSDVISTTPTIFIEIATVRAIKDDSNK